VLNLIEIFDHKHCIRLVDQFLAELLMMPGKLLVIIASVSVPNARQYQNLSKLMFTL